MVFFNLNLERWVVNYLESANDQPPGVINGGSNSFVQGKLRRFVTYGFTTGGGNCSPFVANNYNCWYGNYGYAFPLGQREDNRDYYRPLTFSFPVNMGEIYSVVVSTNVAESLEILPIISVPGVNGTIRLNNAAAARWDVAFESRPILEPNIRIGAQGIITNPNANIDDMRIVGRSNATSSWGMLGVYDLYDGVNPDDTYNPNDWIDGIPIFYQEGVDIFARSVSGPYTAEVRIAATCPANCFKGSGTVAFLQVIHNSPKGAVDLLVNDAMFLDNFAYQTATAFTPVAADTPLDFSFKTANGATELLSIKNASLESGKRYILIIQGGADGKPFEVKVIDYARSTSTND